MDNVHNVVKCKKARSIYVYMCTITTKRENIHVQKKSTRGKE